MPVGVLDGRATTVDADWLVVQGFQALRIGGLHLSHNDSVNRGRRDRVGRFHQLNVNGCGANRKQVSADFNRLEYCRLEAVLSRHINESDRDRSVHVDAEHANARSGVPGLHQKHI
jgi:hypothetical protein